MRRESGSAFLVGMGIWVLTVLAAVNAGCISYHKPPAPGKPAATVKFRINHYYYPSGANRFSNVLNIDDRRWPFHAVARGATATWTRVKPGWRTIELDTYLAYSYSRIESYTRYYSERYRCGSSTCYRSKSRTEYRTRYYTSVLGRCRRRFLAWFQNGAQYLIQYSYVGPVSCNMTCHQQVFTPDGRFRLLPCHTH